jgi:4-hydroxy-2-oxoheptanedioate aldolase
MHLPIIHSFKEKLANGGAVYGPFMKALDASFMEITGYAGFDFAILDMEHGPAGFAQMQELIRGATLGGLASFVRTPDSSESAISKALDLGASGVQVPQIQSAAQAQAVIRAAKYFPKGERGVCRFVRAANYSSTPRNDYFAQANEALVILQVEGQEGLDALDGILAVEGIDILFIGPYDLSQSLGVPGDVANPKVIAAIKEITERAKVAGVVTGVFADTFEAAKRWKTAGIQYISYSTDVGIYTEACKNILANIRE